MLRCSVIVRVPPFVAKRNAEATANRETETTGGSFRILLHTNWSPVCAVRELLGCL